jgi:8-oxo-dGTP pyrophosphatase MutT (NUDIX family)
MRRLTAAELRAALARHPLPEIPALPGRRNDQLAGVLVPLVLDGEPEAIVTLRAADLSRHAGEICFPGGKLEPGDADLLSAALREAREELGIAQAEVLGRLTSMPLYTSDFRLVPFVAAIPALPLRPAATEVAAVLRLPLLAVLDQPTIEGIPFVWNGFELLSPVFFPEGLPMFGATAHTFYELLAVVAGVLDRRVPRVVRGERSWSEVRSDP